MTRPSTIRITVQAPPRKFDAQIRNCLAAKRSIWIETEMAKAAGIVNQTLDDIGHAPDVRWPAWMTEGLI